MNQEEKDFRRSCVEQLRGDLVRLLSSRQRDLIDIEGKRAELQESVRKLQQDLIAVDCLLEQIG